MAPVCRRGQRLWQLHSAAGALCALCREVRAPRPVGGLDVQQRCGVIEVLFMRRHSSVAATDSPKRGCVLRGCVVICGRRQDDVKRALMRDMDSAKD